MKHCLGICLFLIAYPMNAQEVESSAPFHYPQTTLWAARTESKAKFKSDTIDQHYEMKPPGINSYGFDIETPYNDRFNIGFFFNFDYFKSGTISDLDLQFRLASLLGFFGRLQYNPFASDLNLFARADFGFGPVVQGFSGLMIHAGVSGRV